MNTSYEPAPVQPEATDVLYDLYPENQLEEASMGQRFANYLIDLVGYYLFCLLLGAIIGLLQLTSVLEAIVSITENDFGNILFSLSLYFVFMTLSEGIGKGKSLGKLITGTRAVKEDGSRINFGDASLRSLSRVVPFEQLSIFFGWRPWHDKWTNTMVIKKQQQ